MFAAVQVNIFWVQARTSGERPMLLVRNTRAKRCNSNYTIKEALRSCGEWEKCRKVFGIAIGLQGAY